MRIQSGITPEIKNSIVMKAAFGGETRALQNELKTDAVRSVDADMKQQRVSHLSSRIQNILEKMDESRPAQSVNREEEALKSNHNETKNRTGHVDMMV